jgi:uncharacterized protein (DUF1697 family)
MPTYAAFLRAINLGSHNKLAMPRLREIVETLPAEDVTTHVQSGNVVFRSTMRSAARVEAALEKALKQEAGLDVRVMVRTPAQLKRLLDGCPFAAHCDDPTKLHVTFLDAKPEKAKVDAIDPEGFLPDVFAVEGQDVFLFCPEGYGRSKLSNAYFERKLGVAGTTRNWRTVTTLAELSSR